MDLGGSQATLPPPSPQRVAVLSAAPADFIYMVMRAQSFCPTPIQRTEDAFFGGSPNTPEDLKMGVTLSRLCSRRLCAPAAARLFKSSSLSFLLAPWLQGLSCNAEPVEAGPCLPSAG